MTKGFDVRDLAIEALTNVERGELVATKSLDEILSRTYGLQERDRAFVTELVYGVLRHRRRIDRAIQAYSKKRITSSHPLLLRVLRLAVYQILFLDRVPPRAAVHSAVGFVRKRMGKPRAGFANAVLRALLRDGEPPLPSRDVEPLEYMKEAFSYSDWMADLFVARLGLDACVALGEALSERYKTVIRANSLKTTKNELMKLLGADLGERAESGESESGERAVLCDDGVRVEACRYAPQGLIVQNLPDPTRHPLHKEGYFEVQEEASQLISHLLDPGKGERILDACGGAGGKALHIYGLSKGSSSILCCDSSEHRLGLARERFFQATGESLDVRVIDWTQDEVFLKGEHFDRVLLDAPCTGIGALRRHPEAKWRIDEGVLKAMVKLQRRLLERVAPLTAPGGIILYAVCTISSQEGTEQVREFLRTHPDFCIDFDIEKTNPAQRFLDENGEFFTWPHLHTMDGFYGVRLRRCEENF